MKHRSMSHICSEGLSTFPCGIQIKQILSFLPYIFYILCDNLVLSPRKKFLNSLTLVVAESMRPVIGRIFQAGPKDSHLLVYMVAIVPSISRMMKLPYVNKKKEISLSW